MIIRSCIDRFLALLARVGNSQSHSSRFDPNPRDILRILPFGGQAALVEMTGAVLARVLKQGETNRGTGGFLQRGRIVRDGDQWRINGTLLESKKRYKVVLTDFLLTGQEAGLTFLKPPSVGMTVLKSKVGDIRRALAERLKKEFGTSPVSMKGSLKRDSMVNLFVLMQDQSKRGDRLARLGIASLQISWQ